MNASAMPEQNHTPGPWGIRRSNDGSGDVGITSPGLPNILAECFGAMRSSGERAVDEAMANARLIAAAPEMLAALIRLAEWAQGTQAMAEGEEDNAALDAVHAAIAKASV